jgi:23S rRNA (adenine1618-N6)-methyltransferase
MSQDEATKVHCEKNNLESQSAATKTTKPILNFGGHNAECGAKVANLVS